MKILFISHTYPPIIGGVENQNFELYTSLSKNVEIKLLANRKRWFIPFFLFYAAIKAIILQKNYDLILLGSCVLGNVGWLVKKTSSKPVMAIAHGLDLTWKNSFYQKFWLKIFIPQIDKIIAVGNETIKIAIEKGISKEKIIFIPNGVNTEKIFNHHTRSELEKILEESISDKKTLLTSGRLAKRKGVAWFIENVLPLLPENIIYIVAGDGPDKKNIKNITQQTGLKKRVKILGLVSDKTREILMNTCDLFIQPNIKVNGDMEGFGISVIEAASCKLPVLASRLEGLQDAIKDGENGFLIEPYDSNAYANKIKELLANDDLRKNFGEKSRQFVINNYEWENIAKKYVQEMEYFLKNKK